jgi:PKD repeat protein
VIRINPHLFNLINHIKMKKLLLSATACFLVASSIKAQQIQPCGTYQAREIHLKNTPGYAAKLNASEATSAAEYQAYLQNLNSAAKSSSLTETYTYTVPVVFHVLHLGEQVGTGTNVSDATLINTLAQVNRDFARKGSDTINIDPLFDSLYINSRIHFELAKKDPKGNCTNGIVRHYDPNTNWSQSDFFNFKYSTMAPGNWNPSKYLNIYIVKNIIDDGGSSGTIVGYTYIPGTSPIDPADAIVYRYDFLTGLNARSMSHEIGHWLGLSHTFGSSNNAGVECGNDDIGDTPATTGFFSTCPKAALYSNNLVVANPSDSSDIVKVDFGTIITTAGPVIPLFNTSSLNSAVGVFSFPTSTKTGTTSVTAYHTGTATANGTVGGYSDYSSIYPFDFASGTNLQIKITSTASYSVNNYVAVYLDKNRNGSFSDGGETIFVSSANLFGTQTFSTSTSLTGTGLMRMRVITSNSPITNATAALSSGEFEDYTLNIGLISCQADLRPNIENIMDYSACPKMFTKAQTGKMRQSLRSMVSLRQLVVDTNNLKFTGILDANGNPTSTTPCAPIADFASNKYINCAGQAFTFNSTSYNFSSPITSYSWEFEGGSPATSTLATQAVTYANPGTYSVSLTVTNADGTSSKSKSSYVKTEWNAGQITLPYKEDFESGQWWPQGMVIKNNDAGSPSWELSNYGAGVTAPSMKSIVLPNANYVGGFPGFASHIDILELPAFDFTNTTNISFSFDYSFARKNAVVADTFKIQYSLDCGGSWINLPGAPAAAVLATSGGTVNAPYIPWSSVTSSVVPNPKWITKTISSVVLGGLNNKRDVKFRFWFQNDIATGTSQNLYIDNINVSGTVGLNEFENSLGLSIYPNPTSSSSIIEFTSPSNSKANILVYDVTGRVIEEGNMTVNSGVSSKYTVNASNQLNSGVYFISITIDGKKVTKKLIIE